MDSSPSSADEGGDQAAEGTDAEPPREGGEAAGAGTDDDPELEELRRAVEEKYDFDNFGPADMARMTAEEWDAAFDPESWITGRELLDRVEKDLKRQIAYRDVFAVLERIEEEGEERVIAYSDEGYAVVYPDGSVEGRGTVLRDVKPVVALCSMDDYEVSEPPENYELPSPESVPEQTGEFGNLMLQIIAGMQLLGGAALILAWLFAGIETIVAPVIGGLFLAVGLFLFTVVANARLSDRFRAEQYRNRLRAVRPEDVDRPDIPRGDRGENADSEHRRDGRDRETEGA